jgi:pimeloyl-ACP methyl ester carboxylesterase
MVSSGKGALLYFLLYVRLSHAQGAEMAEALLSGYRPQTIRLPGGRHLGYCLYGPGDGVPVVFYYGTPGTMFLAPDRLVPVDELGIRLLVADRPGYGASTRLPGRAIASVADDLAVLADRLGWDRFAVWGGSGGGPHALACAALLGDRVTRCASVVGPAPFDADGLDWLAGMSALNVEEFTCALAGEAAYRPMAKQLARDAVSAAERGDLAVADGYDLAEADRAVLTAQARSPGHLFRTRAAYTGGVDGCVDDMLALTRPWGFDVAAIGAPVSLWYGPDDVLCPHAHTDWLVEHISGAEAMELPGGHVLDLPSLRRLYAWLLNSKLT